MRSVDLAVYADSLAAQAAALAARLEQVRARERRAAIEQEARSALEPAVVARLERLGVLGPGCSDTDAEASEIVEAAAALKAVRMLQAWVEARLADARTDAPSDVRTEAPARVPRSRAGEVAMR